MNILIRKLIFNEEDIHVIKWNKQPCFFVSELSKALDSVNKDDISNFLRHGGSCVKGIDYDVVGGAEAKDLKNDLESSGIKKKFVQTMIIYFEGLSKYFNFRKTVESRDFINYLAKSKISLESNSIIDSNIMQDTAAAVESVVPEVVEVVDVKSTELNIKEAKPIKARRREKATAAVVENTGYSDFLKHISFMEDFVDSFNKLNITGDKSVAFTKSMVKYLEDNGIQANDFLKEIKKWIV